MALVNKNKFISNLFKDLSHGVCNSMTKVRPKDAKVSQQYIKLTEKERNTLNELLIAKYGETMTQGRQIKSKTPFEYSSRMVYEFINKRWIFETRK